MYQKSLYLLLPFGFMVLIAGCAGSTGVGVSLSGPFSSATSSKTSITPPGGTVDVDKNIPKTHRKNQFAVGIIIGNKEYKNTFPVEYAENDAQTVKNYFISTFGIPAENIMYLKNATKGEFEDCFGSEIQFEPCWLNQMIIPDSSDVYIYYSGHGFADLASNEAYFVTSETSLQRIVLTGYRRQTLFSNLSQMPARSYTIIIDACFSGLSPKGPIAPGISPLGLKVRDLSLVLGQHGLVFTSASSNQVSNWYDRKKHSLFTYCFLKGLQDEADQNKDKVIIASEMENYLTDPINGVSRLARILNLHDQNPQVTGDKSRILFSP